MIRRTPGTKMIDEQQPIVYEAMSCGHSSRYRYNADIAEQSSGDSAESWHCAICEIADLKRQLREQVEINIVAHPELDAYVQEKVAQAVLAESEWWASSASYSYSLDAKDRLAANRAKVKPTPPAENSQK